MNYTFFDDYCSLFPVQGKLSAGQILLINELMKKRSELNIKIVFKKCEHEPMRFDPNKVIKRFHDPI